MRRVKLKAIAGAALLASVTVLATGCYYYGYDDPYYARRDWRYDRYYDRRYDPRYDRDYDRYGYWHYHRGYSRYYDSRTARLSRHNKDYDSD